jgi:hypothetical protein
MFMTTRIRKPAEASDGRLGVGLCHAPRLVPIKPARIPLPWRRGRDRRSGGAPSAGGRGTWSSVPMKTRVVDAALERVSARTLADLGGVWAVNGRYTLHALDRHEVERAVIVDARLTDDLVDRARSEPRLRLIEANFGSAEVAAEVGDVDVVLLFDVLLHQVAPDWNEVLAMYAESARCVAVVNPQYMGPRTVRLLELGIDRYRQLVPPQRSLDDVLAKPQELHPTYGRPYRDIFEIWQWGIVDADLTASMERLGFRLTYFEDAGAWKDFDAFENHGFVFVRRG